MKILFICTANSARSIMAEAILRQFAGAEIDVFSAGTNPTKVDAEAISALQSLGIATDTLKSQAITELNETQFDYVISLCDRARAECNVEFQGMNFVAWDFPDPGLSREHNAFKKTAQELSERIRMFLLILRKQTQKGHVFNSPKDLFKIMSDPLRLQIILMLAKHGELCVCDFVAGTQMSQPKVSRHLAQLRAYGLLIDRKDQRWVYYKINPALPDWMQNVIAVTAQYNPQLQAEIAQDCA